MGSTRQTGFVPIILYASFLWSQVSMSLAAEPSLSLRPWTNYQTIMWVGDSALKQPEKIPLFIHRLREMGINTAMVHGDQDPAPWVSNTFPYYVENMVNRGLCLKWNSNVRDWDAFVTGWTKSGRPASSMVRDYCLDDEQWRETSRQQVNRLALKNRSNNPLAYNLRDELSVTISANPFDYDFNPIALSGFRNWLRTQYRTLADLNSEWDTQFKTWEEVLPFTTDQIKNRMASGDAIPRGQPDWQRLQTVKFDPTEAAKNPARWNFAPWCDFRTYMDLSLARTLGDFRKAAREVDPQTPVGIEGTQMPHAFGGYDLWRLSQVLDWVEPYDIGCAREILGSFMPGKPILTTVFEKETKPARRRLWHLLLEGDRGCIIWWSEDSIDWKTADYALTAKANALAPALREMTSPLARLFMNASPEFDPIYIHYSQPSIQVDWLMESNVDGSTWLRRFSSFEAEHNLMAKARDGWLKALQDLGYSPRFLSSEQIDHGALSKLTNAALVLSKSWVLSSNEASKIESFVGQGSGATARHVLLCDAAPGLFDEHGKIRQVSALPLFTPWGFIQEKTCMAILGNGKPSEAHLDFTSYGRARRVGQDASHFQSWLRQELAPMPPPITTSRSDCVRVHRLNIPRGKLIAFERNVDYQMSEDLKQAGGNEPLEKPIEVEAALQGRAHVYDLRSQRYLGELDKLHFTLDPWQPSLFALTETKLPDGDIMKLLAERH